MAYTCVIDIGALVELLLEILQISDWGAVKDVIVAQRMNIYFHSGVVIGVEFPTYEVDESNGTIEVCAILISGTLERIVTFALSTQDGSATSTDPLDFSAVLKNLTFDQKSSRQCVDIPIKDDDIVEEPERFTVVVTRDDPDVVITSPTSVVTITDNDRVLIGFEMERYRGDEGETVEVCAILFNGTLEKSLVVDITSRDLSATGKEFCNM